jgi:hypothetical protein
VVPIDSFARPKMKLTAAPMSYGLAIEVTIAGHWIGNPTLVQCGRAQACAADVPQ